MRIFPISILLLVFLQCLSLHNTDYCDKDFDEDCSKPTIKYLFYDVNPPEGFNLRRDVFMRFAIFARKLSQSKDPEFKAYRLVLPPWSNLYHWQKTGQPEYLPWGLFFDVESIQKFAPVIEMHDFFANFERTYQKVAIDKVYVLQHFEDMFASGKFEEKMSLAPCTKPPTPTFFYYHNITGKQVECVSFHGYTSQLWKLLTDSTVRSIYFDHGEVALHDRYGDAVYWECRRSMRFNKDLIEVAKDFRWRFLNSTNIQDKTDLPADWRNEIPNRNALGGPYLAVHLRRRDFVWGRAKKVPSIENAADQIRDKLIDLHLDVLFVATDAPEGEYEELVGFLKPDIIVHKFRPNKEVKKRFQDGGVAIIEQIICSHARYFMGTYESTFSFRIQEEREIIGFPAQMTFNRFCGDEESDSCYKTTQWKIVY